MRYSDLDHLDLDAAKGKVRQWMLAHPGGTPGQMAADLKGGYPRFPEHTAIVLRGFMAFFQDHPGELDPVSPPGRPGDPACRSARQPGLSCPGLVPVHAGSPPARQTCMRPRTSPAPTETAS